MISRAGKVLLLFAFLLVALSETSDFVRHGSLFIDLASSGIYIVYRSRVFEADWVLHLVQMPIHTVLRLRFRFSYRVVLLTNYSLADFWRKAQNQQRGSERTP